MCFRSSGPQHLVVEAKLLMRTQIVARDDHSLSVIIRK